MALPINCHGPAHKTVMAGVSGPPMPARAATDGPDKPNHDDREGATTCRNHHWALLTDPPPPLLQASGIAAGMTEAGHSDTDRFIA
jgi:hypothetical protein